MDAREQYALWRSKTLEDADLTAELVAIEGNESEIRERFYTDLKFGTAGLRGILGAGINRMNIYTVRRATQGLAAYIRRRDPNGSAAIAYDSRNKSQLFAQTAAAVLAANGIHVYLYPALAPTPLLSWAVRYYGCCAGIVVTASHNPAEFNGYKAYGADGCQMTSEAADEVLEEIGKVDLFEGACRIDFADALAEGRISYVPEQTIAAYYEQVFACQLRPDVIEKSGVSVAYTPLNGTGMEFVRSVLTRAGLQKFTAVPQQEHPDGDFPTCRYPNPETPEAMALGMILAKEVGADLLIGTDPDADRVGVAVRRNGGYTLLSGNEVGVLLADYIGASRVEQRTMPDRPVMIRSIVSTPLADLVAQSYGVEMIRVLTGFKYIGEQIHALEERGEVGRFLFGFEESCGYLPGSFVRDKDGVAASLLIVEMAAWHKTQGRTLMEALDALYQKFGYFYNHVSNTAFAGADGMKRMAELMDSLFASPPEALGGYRVVERRDLRASVAYRDGVSTPIDLPTSDVLLLLLDNGATVVIRPSGTEAKLKVYYMVKDSSPAAAKEQAGVLERAVSARLGL